MKQNKKFKILFSFILAVVFIIFFILIISYSFGGTRSVDSTVIWNVDYNADKIRVIVDTSGSGNAYAGCKVIKDGGKMYITIKDTLVGFGGDSGSAYLELVGDFNNIKNIYIADGINKKQIYPHNYGETIEDTIRKHDWLPGETDKKIIKVK